MPFLSEYVLGVRIAEPGCKKLIIFPALGDLEWAEGTVPTPYGDVFVRHERDGEGVRTCFRAPDGIEISVAEGK